MLDQASAIGFNRQLESKVGASQPLIVRVQSRDNEWDAYIKLTDKLPLGIKSLVNEAVASMLACDLEIATPRPLLVEISPEFIDSVHDANVAQRLRISCKNTFGTEKLPTGTANVIHGMPLRKDNMQLAADIFLFDVLIENYDRGSAGKNNCLTDTASFFIIDHEKAFPNAALPVIGRMDPWRLGGLDRYTQPDSHLFVNQLRGKANQLNFEPIIEKWKSVEDTRLNEYIGALPGEWNAESAYTTKVLTIISDIRDHMEDCVAEICRVLG